MLLVDVRENGREAANKILSCKDDRDRTLAIYSVDASDRDGGRTFCTSGRDKYVRVYDRRNAAEAVKKYCPHHIVSFLDLLIMIFVIFFL